MAFKLETAIVRIVTSNGKTVGAGFILMDHGLTSTTPTWLGLPELGDAAELILLHRRESHHCG